MTITEGWLYKNLVWLDFLNVNYQFMDTPCLWQQKLDLKRTKITWDVLLPFKADYLTVDLVLGGISKGSQPVSKRVSEKKPLSAIWTRRFPSTSFERRTARPLVGPRTDSLTSMPYPGFKFRTFGRPWTNDNNWIQNCIYSYFSLFLLFEIVKQHYKIYFININYK